MHEGQSFVLAAQGYYHTRLRQRLRPIRHALDRSGYGGHGWRARIGGTMIGRDTRVDVFYFYKSCRQYIRYGKFTACAGGAVERSRMKVLYASRNLRVMTMGMNDIYQKTRLWPNRFKDTWESGECSRIEIGAACGKQTEIQLDM